VAAASAKGVAALRAAHVADHQTLFRRVTLDLGRTSAADRPTDERVRTFPDGGDPALAALYFQYARYLLISSSRRGSQPANLQGIWNASLDPPWGSKYTININTQMNYWPASTTNLDECFDPLVAMVPPRCTAPAAGSHITTRTSGVPPRPLTARRGESGQPAAPGSPWRCGIAIGSRAIGPTSSTSIRRFAARRRSSSTRWSKNRRIGGS
jgi:hypothetical protein